MEVLYEDNHIIIVNKKSGEITQGDKTGDEPLSEKIKRFIKHRDKKTGNVFLGTVHRLDRPVSGVILFSKTSKALSRLNKMFQEKQVHKTYWAKCVMPPKIESKKLIHYLVKDEKKNKTKAHNRPVLNGKKSELVYKHLKKNSINNLIEVLPLTGRPHQIRVQLASIDCIILGDLKYGALFPNKDKSICLHAKRIEFIHPVSNIKIDVTAPLPKGTWNT
jgi:23S rRNA pseudouridine1911/1915/1917 synthase